MSSSKKDLKSKKKSKTFSSNNFPKDNNDRYMIANEAVMNECKKSRKGASVAGNRIFFWWKVRKKEGVDYVDFYPGYLAGEMACTRKTICRWVQELVDQDLFTLEKLNPHHRLVQYRMRPTAKFLALKGFVEKTTEADIEKKAAEVENKQILTKDNNQGVYAQNSCLNVLQNNKSNKSFSSLTNFKQKKTRVDEADDIVEEKRESIPLQNHSEIPLAQQMINIWNENIDPEIKVTPNRHRCRYLIAALKFKFNGSIKKWKEYCLQIASSDYLMGKFRNGFKIILDSALKFNFIQKIFEKAFGVKDLIVEEPRNIVEKAMKQEIVSLQEPEKAKEIRLNLLKKYGVHTYKSWFEKLDFFEKDGSIHRKERPRFEEDWLEQKFNLMKVNINV